MILLWIILGIASIIGIVAILYHICMRQGIKE